MKEPEWLGRPEEHDFGAAFEYLSLMFRTAAMDYTVHRLYGESVVIRKAKDILRASELPILPKSDKHVAKDLDKIEKGEKLSPVLLVRGRGRLYIADGYHRVCACYHLEDDTLVHCLLGDLIE